jgi:hypothetical protein
MASEGEDLEDADRGRDEAEEGSEALETSTAAPAGTEVQDSASGALANGNSAGKSLEKQHARNHVALGAATKVQVLGKLEQQDSGSLAGDDDTEEGGWDEHDSRPEAAGEEMKGSQLAHSSQAEQQQQQRRQDGSMGTVQQGKEEGPRSELELLLPLQQQHLSDAVAQGHAVGAQQAELVEQPPPALLLQAAAAMQGEGKIGALAAAAGPAGSYDGASVVRGTTLDRDVLCFNALALLDVSYNRISAEDLLGMSSPLARLPKYVFKCTYPSQYL